MNEFMATFNRIVESFPLTLDIHYSKTMDWVIKVRKRGCANDYPKSMSDGEDALLFYLQHTEIDRLFSTATKLLVRWMRRNVPEVLRHEKCADCFWFWKNQNEYVGLCRNGMRSDFPAIVRPTNVCGFFESQEA